MTRYRKSNPDTSKSAANKARDLALAHKALVVSVLRHGKPYTSEEIATMLRLDPLQVMKRISDLRTDSLVEDTGARRENSSGRKAAVWRLRSQAA